jgi:dephospho-CoA kinase
LLEPVFVEVPLLFECNYQNEFDAVMVIARDKNARIDSVKRRSNLTEEEIISRMAKQTDYDSFDLTPYFCIANDSDELSLKEKVLTTAKKIVEQ